MKRTVFALTVLIAVTLASSAAFADAASDEADIRNIVDDTWAKIAEKRYDGNDLNEDGAWQATSHGGLWRLVNREEQKALLNDSPDTLTVAANHVDVTFLGAKNDVAYVTFYLTGTIKLGSGDVIPDYRTRASWVMEKKNGNWVVSGAHYSPLFGGSGVLFD